MAARSRIARANDWGAERKRRHTGHVARAMNRLENFVLGVLGAGGIETREEICMSLCFRARV